MKKSLVALAALAATGAFAQSSVTLYGRIDAGLFNQTVETQAAGSKVTTFDLAGAQNTKTGARLGVTGVEDLGGGLKAGFVIESRVNIDNSVNTAGGFAQGTFGATRQANINLNGGFGTIVLGTFYNAFDDLRFAHSPNIGGLAGGDLFSRTAISGNAALNGATTSAISERSQNGLGYSTPSFGGFKVRASVLSRKNVTSGGGAADATAPPGVKLNGLGIAAGYDNGPLSVLGVLGVVKGETVPAGTQITKINDFGVNVKYDFGVVVPYFIFEQSKVNAAGSAYKKGQGFELGAKFPLGAFTPYITANVAKFSTDVAGVKGKLSGLQIGTNYDISKRTSAYVAFGTDKVSDTTGVETFTKRNGLALGLVHKF